MSPMTDTYPEPSEMIEEGRRMRALELAVQLHVARATSGLTSLGDEVLTLDAVETAKAFEAYLRGAEESTA